MQNHQCKLDTSKHTKPPGHTQETPCVWCCHRCVGVCSLPDNTPKWLVEVYDAVAERRVRHALDLVFETIDDLFLEGKFEEVDEILPAVDVNRLDENLMVGFLTITLAAKDQLTNREGLYQRAEEKLSQDMDPATVEQCLRGLE